MLKSKAGMFVARKVTMIAFGFSPKNNLFRLPHILITFKPLNLVTGPALSVSLTCFVINSTFFGISLISSSSSLGITF